MKLVERSAERLVFSLSLREKTFLGRLLSYYPLDPDSTPRLSREGLAEHAEAEAFLHESLREHRQESAGWVRMHLAEGAALRSGVGGWRLTLEGEDADRFLQVLNELRVGAWSRLGCPDKIDDESLSERPGDVPLFAIMTLAGQFQMVLLHALDGEASPDAGAGAGSGSGSGSS